MIDILGYVLLYIGAVISVAHIYDLTYKFQVKEYRFDRFIESLKEIGFREVVYTFQIRFPAKTIRNILIVALSVLLLAIAVFFVQELPFLFLFVFIVFAPVVSLILVSVSVLITEVLAQLKRRKIIIEAQEYIGKTKVEVIGITGSYGKTTTKEYLYQILSAKFNTAKTEATMNTDVGIAMSISKSVSPETRYFIAEMGAYKIGEIKKATVIAKPKYAIVTAIGNQHLGLFGSMRNLLDAKRELLEAVPKTGRIYLNKAIKDRSVLARGVMAPIVQFAVKGKADVMARKVSATAYEINYGKKRVRLDLSDKPPYALENLMPCVALALDLGMKPEDVQNALKTLKTVPSKLSQQKGAKGSLVVLDTANSSVEGFLAAIDYIGALKRKEKFAVSKGIIELGSEKETSYKRLLAEITKNKIKLITTDRLFANLDTKRVVEYFPDEKSIKSYLADIVGKQTVLLLEGRFTPDFIKSVSV